MKLPRISHCTNSYLCSCLSARRDLFLSLNSAQAGSLSKDRNNIAKFWPLNAVTLKFTPERKTRDINITVHFWDESDSSSLVYVF